MTTQKHPVLAVREVGFRREGADILSAISCTLNKNEIFCLLGPSGSGKTTLLRIVAGLLSPSSGIVDIEGVNQASIPTHKRNIGFVFQDPAALFPHLSVFENVAFPLRVRKESSISSTQLRARVNETLAAVKLTHKSADKPSQLSGGERQRVALARAFVYQPALLLLDEPLNSLDNVTKNELLPYISDLRRRFPTTCLYVTHDQREAQQVADRIGILIAGRIVAEGTTEEVFDNPDSVTVAQLTAEWNVITAEIKSGSDAIRLPSGTTPEIISSRSFGDKVLPQSNSQVWFGFPIREAMITDGVGHTPNMVVFSGMLSTTYRIDGRIEAIIQVGQNRLKVRWSEGHAALPKIGTNARFTVPLSSLRVLHRDS